MKPFTKSFRRSHRGSGAARNRVGRIELLEDRRFLVGGTPAAGPFSDLFEPAAELAGLNAGNAPTVIIHHAASAQFEPISVAIASDGSVAPAGYTPSEVRNAYGLGPINDNGLLPGAGQTIAIVDAYDDPTIAQDLASFDLAFGLPAANFTKVEQVVNGVPPAPDAQWATEISLDVEWAHVIAPGATIMLVEANDSSNYLFDAVDWARNQPGVSVVSMSFGSLDASGENSLDATFTTPAGHEGVTFVAASGDRGNAGYPVDSPFGSYPAVSPNVVGVGATDLYTDAAGNYIDEIATEYSGGGFSAYEVEPSYQLVAGIDSGGWRTSPDVSFVGGETYFGMPIYDSYSDGASTPWNGVAGTSAAAPQFAGLIAIADQGRAALGEDTLDGPSQTLPLLYELHSSFHDVTQGGNPAYQATPGYDVVTGLGTPIANILVPQLIAGGFLPLSAQGGFTVNSVAGEALVNQELATFADPNGTLGPGGYSATIDWGNGSPASLGTIGTDANGQMAVFGTHLYAGQGDDTIYVTIGSGRAGAPGPIAIQSLAVVAPPAPSAPTANPETFVLGPGGTASGGGPTGVLANATSADGRPQDLTATLVANVSHGSLTLNPDGSVTFTPNSTFQGIDRFTYQVSEDGAFGNEATDTILSYNASLVDKLYQQVLHRPAEDAGLVGWTAQLDYGTSLDVVAQAIFTSPERLDPLVNQFYVQYLNRAAESAGLSVWVSTWQTNGDPDGLEADILASPEFYVDASAAFLATSQDANQAFVKLLYQRLLERPFDPVGITDWTAVLDAGQLTRNQVAADFLNSSELHADLVDALFGEYFDDPNPTPAQAAPYVTDLNDGQTRTQVELEMINSQQYEDASPEPAAGTVAIITLYPH
ncbi:MAG TPA: DUF4214 domain-containing protein [Pirellulales bacterium]|nr:DUF4214 domain-containing protein [Pirellulales bacterium]